MLILKTNNLSKIYNGHPAVNDVNMNINKGDIYGFIGENGAGKTTLIRLVTGLANITSGSYELFGVNNLDANIYQVKRKVSTIVESPSLYLNMNAYNNLLIQAQILGIKDMSILDDTLKVVDLFYLRDSKKLVKNFSLGMKQRLGLAIALIGKPEFILLDEPMNGLDPEGIVKIRQLILKLNRENNITFLISSHNLNELSKLVNKYGFISHGKLIQEITVEKLQRQFEKQIELEVYDNEKTINALKELDIDNYNNIDINKFIIYQDQEISDLASSLNKKGVKINSISEKKANIEDYYLHLLGEKRND